MEIVSEGTEALVAVYDRWFPDAQPISSAANTLPNDLALGSNLDERDFPYTTVNIRRIKQGLKTRTKEAGWNGRDKWLDTMFSMRTLHSLAGWPEDKVWKLFNAYSKWVNAGDNKYDESRNRKAWDAPERENGKLKTFASILDDAKPIPPEPSSPAHTSGISAADLATKVFQPLKWIVDGVLPEGSYLLSARPKVGKSWLALQICLAVAYGDMLWGRQVQQGDAVYLALEENQRRLQKRLGQLRGEWGTPNLLLYTGWKRSDQGGLVDLEKLLADKKPRLVVIDTLAKIRAPSGRSGSAYEGDYQALAPITEMANKYRCCIVIVTHNRKGKSEGDATEMVSGTLGQMGAVDGALVIDGNRGDDTMKLTLVGRDIEEDGEFAIKKLPQGGWDWLGKADEVFISNERKAIIDLLRSAGCLKPKEIAERLGKPSGNIRKLLFTMAGIQQVTLIEDWRYAAARLTCPLSTRTLFLGCGNESNRGNDSNRGNGGNDGTLVLEAYESKVGTTRRNRRTHVIGVTHIPSVTGVTTVAYLTTIESNLPRNQY